MDIVLTLLLASVVLTVAFYRGFFFLPEKIASVASISRSLVLKAVIFFFALELLLSPVLAVLFVSFATGISIQGMEKMDPVTLAWVNSVSVALSALGMYLFFRAQSFVCQEEVWGVATGMEGRRAFLFGLLAWLVSYPLLVFFELSITIIMAQLGIDVEGDQVAVKQVKQVLGDPWAFGVLAFTVCVLAPFIEELVFRGFIQQGLKQFCSIRTSILITSVVFATIHFSKSQGYSNILLIGTLFVLSCFLGFVREKKGSLWASIGLHSTFNAINVSLIAATA